MLLLWTGSMLSQKGKSYLRYSAACSYPFPVSFSVFPENGHNSLIIKEVGRTGFEPVKAKPDDLQSSSVTAWFNSEGGAAI